MRRTITLALTAALMGLAVVAIPSVPAPAQDAGARNGEIDRPEQQRVRPVVARPRIVITPAQRLVRVCEDSYAVENRATGPTVVPNTQCWWAYR